MRSSAEVVRALDLKPVRRSSYVAGGMRRDLHSGSMVNVLLMRQMIEDAHNMGLDFDFGSIGCGAARSSKPKPGWKAFSEA